MSENFKVYSASFFVLFDQCLDLLNPLLSFILLILTIFYTFFKLKNERYKSKNNK